MDTASGPVGHEGPKINGSAPAFYALIIVLSLVIAVAFAAVIYLLLEERADRRSEDRHMHRPVDDESVKDPSYQPTTKWYKRIFGMGSNGNQDGVRDMGTNHRGQGWIQAGTTDEWESNESAEESKSRGQPSSPPQEYNPSLVTKRTSATYSLPRRSLVYSFVSDRSSVLPSDLPVLPYEDASAPSIRYSIPSIYSQLLPSSPGSVSHCAHQLNCTISTVSATPVRISTTARMPSSPVSIGHAPSDSHDGSDLAETMSQKPSLRTFEGGTKFIEVL